MSEAETHADVIADIRKKYPASPDCEPTVSGQFVHDEMEWLAARLEAAYKHEALAPFPSLCEWLIENAAKLGISDMVAKLRERGDKARAALASPPRNCDRFGTDNTEVAQAYEDFCDRAEIEESVNGAIAWLFAPAERREGGAK